MKRATANTNNNIRNIAGNNRNFQPVFASLISYTSLGKEKVSF